MTKCKNLVLSALAAVALLSGCYGPFNATRSLHKWNGEISESKWAVEGVFLAASIIPVYGLFVIGDALIFNSIEFWGGKNPIDPPGSAQLDAPQQGTDGEPIPTEGKEVAAR